MSVDRLAKLIADELRPELRLLLREELQHVDLEPGRRLSARECADRWGHTAKWWREHKAEFGARQVGDGPRPRWEFDPAEVERVLRERPALDGPSGDVRWLRMVCRSDQPGSIGSMSAEVKAERFMTPSEVAELAQVSVSTVKREIARGELRALHVGHQLRTDPADFRAYLEREER